MTPLTSMTTTSWTIPATDRVTRTPAELRLFDEPLAYQTAWDLQTRIHQERVADLRPDTVLILEHLPVYTLGRSAKTADWGGDPALLRAGGAELHHVNRGGSVTYHGPGQAVVYPLLRLARYASGVKQYVRLLEEVIIRCLQGQGIEGRRRDKTPGVWVTVPHEAKIASIGIRVDRGVTLHGIALNVEMDLSPFDRITPCGLPDCRVTSMAQVLGRPVSIAGVKRELSDQLRSLLEIEWIPSDHNRQTDAKDEH